MGELPQGTLDLLILKVIGLQPAHGYAIAQRLQQVSGSFVRAPQGSLYPALHRLERRGLLAASWTTTPAGREVRCYRLTPRGRRQLERSARDWEQLSRTVAAVLQLAPVETQ